MEPPVPPSRSQPGPEPETPLSERISRVEEGLAFTEHTVDQLSGEIARLNQRMQQLQSKLESLDRRVQKLLEGPDEPAD